MKLQIKTLARKQLVIDIEDTKTVYDVKRELSLYSDVGVQPELQKLIYNGKVLNNDDQLSVCDIDVKKFMVVMILKQPEVVATPPTSKAAEASTTATNDNSANATTTPKSANTNTSDADTDHVAQIIAMGYPEEEARRALAASYNNVEVAIEYLIEGIPSTLPAPPTIQPGNAATAGGVGADDEWTDIDDDDEEDDPMRFLRRDPLFNALRDSVLQDPTIMETVIQQICGDNRSLATLINENRDEFVRALIADITDSDDDDDDSDEDNE